MMKAKIHIIYIIAFAILSLTACEYETDLYQVVKVIDGDTIKVSINGNEENIRFLLIDTPETVHPNKPVQPYGPEASAFVKNLIEGKKVRLELDVSERDKYGRILAYVYTSDGKMINELLLLEGLARVAYVYAPNTKYVDRFYAIQKQAQKQGKGIWSIEDYNKQEQKSDGCLIKGNINSKGEKIYHLPGGRYYDQTKAEKMFCNEKDAVKAGFRKSKY
jgi:micrococcal nuclease